MYRGLNTYHQVAFVGVVPLGANRARAFAGTLVGAVEIAPVGLLDEFLFSIRDGYTYQYYGDEVIPVEMLE